MIAKLVGLHYPNDRDVRENTFPEPSPVSEINEVSEIKTKISHYLFDIDTMYDTVLGLFEGKLYLFQVDSFKYKTYTAKEIQYHPSEDLVLF